MNEQVNSPDPHGKLYSPRAMVSAEMISQDITSGFSQVITMGGNVHAHFLIWCTHSSSLARGEDTLHLLLGTLLSLLPLVTDGGLAYKTD